MTVIKDDVYYLTEFHPHNSLIHPVVGTIKTHPEDFQVYEVSIDGEICRLGEEQTLKEAYTIDGVQLPSYIDEHLLMLGKPEATIGAEACEALKEFGIINTEPLDNLVKDPTLEIQLTECDDKQTRSGIHKVIKNLLPYLESSFYAGFIIVRIKRSVYKLLEGLNNGTEQLASARDAMRSDTRWDTNNASCLEFNLATKNISSDEVINRLCKILKKTPKTFRLAGLKDKCAVTCQKVTAHHVFFHRLVEAITEFPKDKVAVGQIKYTNTQLSLGKHSGNAFIILEISLLKYLAERISSVQKHGMINYFGRQRFGSGSIPTHWTGATIITGKFDRAIEELLSSNNVDKVLIEECKQLGSNEKTAKESAHKNYGPWSKVGENSCQIILKCFACGYNSATILQKLPRSRVSLYLHAFQAYLFNYAVSNLIQTYKVNPEILDDMIIRENGEFIIGKAKSIDDVYIPLLGDKTICSKTVLQWFIDAAEKVNVTIPYTLTTSFNKPRKMVYADMKIQREKNDLKQENTNETSQIESNSSNEMSNSTNIDSSSPDNIDNDVISNLSNEKLLNQKNEINSNEVDSNDISENMKYQYFVVKWPISGLANLSGDYRKVVMKDFPAAMSTVTANQEDLLHSELSMRYSNSESTLGKDFITEFLNTKSCTKSHVNDNDNAVILCTILPPGSYLTMFLREVLGKEDLITDLSLRRFQKDKSNDISPTKRMIDIES